MKINTGKDLLQEWKENVGVKKFKLGKPLDEPYKFNTVVESILRAFFHPRDYVVGTKKFDDENYLVYLLSSDKEQDIYLVNELALLILYAKDHTPHILIKSKKGYISHANLSNLLFEVYIDRFLTSNNIQTISTVSYTDSNGNNKPLDNYFEFSGNKYLVECCRVDEPINKSMLQISEYLITAFATSKIVDYKMFRGHIRFKTNKALSDSIDRAKGMIWQLYKNYLQCFNTQGLTIYIPQKYQSDEFDIEILPYHLGTSHEQEVEDKKDVYKAIISFHTEIDPTDVRRGQVVITGMKIHPIERANQNLLSKVQGKISQHKDAPSDFNKIIFIEIDLTKGHSPNTPMFSPIGKKDIDYKLFNHLITESISIVFVFKEATSDGIRRDMTFLSHPKHKPLADFLSK
ncbi:hypothetical protein D0N36_03710 [Hymenobacter lapidiphilus]|uniref:hypothetical protein n=1 Tax=Hymenobacter sp. CCM 8763 TaxID=2303334 RepID=UPI000E34ED56|nr:hypothetical protein [Hymenobacter sp. CCM 8763]RFP66464.1 hypothetical protein D0N36_03710 [Hymenobacter sp. CCM 8763]